MTQITHEEAVALAQWKEQILFQIEGVLNGLSTMTSTEDSEAAAEIFDCLLQEDMLRLPDRPEPEPGSSYGTGEIRG